MAVALSRKRKRHQLKDLNTYLEVNEPRVEPQSCTYFYVGFNKYQIVTSNNPVDYLIEYINSCLTDVIGYIREEGFDLCNKATHSHILTHLVCGILSYNKILMSNFYRCIVHGPLLMAEAAILVYRMDNSAALYVSDTMLQDYLASESNTTLLFDSKFDQSDISSTTVDDILKKIPLKVSKPSKIYNQQEDALYDNSACEERIQRLFGGKVDDAPIAESKFIGTLGSYTGTCQMDDIEFKDRLTKKKQTSILHKLFILADHAVTHFLENGPNHSEVRSFITHSGFGTKNVQTLHSSLKIIGTVSGVNGPGLMGSTGGLYGNGLLANDHVTLNYDDGKLLLY
ncbi:Orf106 [Heliothis zea nudivirus]|uniref:Uncharacterized protein n=2 Tax=Betanudivirus hezeae TaxID=3052000 RepID=G9I063_HZNV2|nr:Orf106 [Heliothis zea nudivirus]YP_004956785.1 orf37 gene product [Helicoverpa zea nudivirus 2]AAN04400.1 Orf106 [Heliothis zea nudivirus]AEW69586.1 hypothetical protein Hz2V037 [Helicoverpa zea nudivirus 2]WCZ68517.1 hypothetical protein HvNV037 [Heliothis virescens nudivirus]